MGFSTAFLDLGTDGLQGVLQGFFRQAVDVGRHQVGGLHGADRQALAVQAGDKAGGSTDDLQQLVTLAHEQFQFFAQQGDFLITLGHWGFLQGESITFF